MNLRPRYENVDQAGKDTGEATTLRTRAGWKSNAWNGLSGTIELIDVGRLDDEYNTPPNTQSRTTTLAATPGSTRITCVSGWAANWAISPCASTGNY